MIVLYEANESSLFLVITSGLTLWFAEFHLLWINDSGRCVTLLVQGPLFYAGVSISIAETVKLRVCLDGTCFISCLISIMVFCAPVLWPLLCKHTESHSFAAGRSLPDRAGLYSCAPGNNLNLTLWGYTPGKAPWFFGQNHKQGVMAPTDADQHWGAKPTPGLSLILVLKQELCQGTDRWWVPAPALPASLMFPDTQGEKKLLACFPFREKQKQKAPKPGRSFLFFMFSVECLYLHVAAFLHI